jgi:hypothetical protein
VSGGSPVIDITDTYQRELHARRGVLAARERAHARFSRARIAVALGGAAILVLGGLDLLAWLLAPLAVFVVLATLHARVLNARDRAESAVHFYERGLARIRHQWIGHGRDGGHYRPEEHLYADDLDIFGKGSIFELLATTRTQAGEEMLARWLLSPAPPDTVAARQVAVRELAARLDLRETVAVQGDRLRVGVHAPLLRSWAGSPLRLKGYAARAGLPVLVAVTLTTLYWWATTGRLGPLLMAAALAQMLAAGFFKARVLEVVEAVEAPAHDLDLLASLLRILEREQFASPHLQSLQIGIGTTGQAASSEIARLSRLVAMLASRRNVMFAVPAALLMWATQWAFAIEAWRGRAGVHIPQWLDIVGEFEALMALGTFAAEHPDFVMPELSPGPPSFVATALAHPALPPTAVPNDLALGGPAPHLLIVSGSNMSGKSTFLRALGVNAVLAQMGAPVRATACRLSPLAVSAAIRVQDSLTDGRSRFFAEIRRLKQIVDLTAERRGAVLFLLDEILSGTNSHDRRIGAEALLDGLVAAGAIGLVTTHDLALGRIADRLPEIADNRHFADQFESDVLSFDYRLRPGIVRTSNALALMRSIGLDV